MIIVSVNCDLFYSGTTMRVYKRKIVSFYSFFIRPYLQILLCFYFSENLCFSSVGEYYCTAAAWLCRFGNYPIDKSNYI